MRTNIEVKGGMKMKMNGNRTGQQFAIALMVLAGSSFVAHAGDLTVDNLSVNKTGIVQQAFVVMAASSGVASTNAPAVGDAKLYYNFDSSSTPVSDGSGNGHNATNNAATWVTNGYFNACYSFNGSSSYLNAGNIFDLSGTASNLTVAAWINLSTTAGSDKFVMAKELNPSPYTGWCLAIAANGQAECEAIGSYPQYTLAYSSGPAISTGQWHHVCAIFQSGGGVVNSSLYQDGQLVAIGNTYTGTFSPTTTTSPLCIGARDNAGHSLFPGLIDDVRLWTRALSAAEIAALASNIPASTNVLLQASGANIMLNGSTLIPSLVKQGDISMGIFTNKP